MKTFSIMEVQHNLARILREVEAGHVVGITRRKKLVARLMPPEQEEPVKFPDFEKRARAIWGATWTGTGTSELVKETRGTR